MIADNYPDERIALVSSSLAEARAVMVEGESGIMAVCRPNHQPRFEPSLHRIRFRNGAQAQFSPPPSRKACAGRSTAMLADQAQKEFFVNQALAILDAMHPRTLLASQPAPPATALDGV